MTAPVIHLAIPMAEADYSRPPLRWVIRRARRLQRFFGVHRRLAVAEAINDYFCFSRMHRERVLKLIKGGAYVQGY